MKKLAILASGGGSNAQKIHEFFQNDPNFEIKIVIVNNKNAGVVEKAKSWNVPVKIITKDSFYKSSEVSDQLLEQKIDLVILAGFLWLIPESLLNSFPNKILNIHPALLPKYGGKGMYGINVHQAVLDAKEKESGITIHTIDEEYDRGDFIYQESVNIQHCNTPQDIANLVLKLEHNNFPRVIKEFLQDE
jgi:phosphoribosylglycinamide formyltransferase-1